jgi:YidC/Oxa1 family membrane protein insertase
MTKIMPLMIFFFALSFPAGLTLYWTVSNTFQIVQQYIALNKGMKIREAK